MLMALNYSTSDIIKKEVIRGGFFLQATLAAIIQSMKNFSPTTFIEQGLDFIMSHFEEPV